MHQLDADHEAQAADVADVREAAGQSRMRSRRCAPIGRRSQSARVRATAIVASEAAIATGLPPNVEACAPGVQFMISARAMMALNGRPLAIPLADGENIGRDHVKCSAAHILPVRPMPDWTSSKTSRMPCFLARQLQLPEKILGRNNVAAFALDRFDHDSRHFFGRKTVRNSSSSMVGPRRRHDLPRHAGGTAVRIGNWA